MYYVHSGNAHVPKDPSVLKEFGLYEFHAPYKLQNMPESSPFGQHWLPIVKDVKHEDAEPILTAPFQLRLNQM